MCIFSPWSELVWSGIGSELDIEGLVFFFALPEKHWKGRHSLRDCVAEKGILPYVGCVDSLGSKPDLVQVSAARWLSSLA